MKTICANNIKKVLHYYTHVKKKYPQKREKKKLKKTVSNALTPL